MTCSCGGKLSIEIEVNLELGYYDEAVLDLYWFCTHCKEPWKFNNLPDQSRFEAWVQALMDRVD